MILIELAASLDPSGRGCGRGAIGVAGQVALGLRDRIGQGLPSGYGCECTRRFNAVPLRLHEGCLAVASRCYGCSVIALGRSHLPGVAVRLWSEAQSGLLWDCIAVREEMLLFGFSASVIGAPGSPKTRHGKLCLRS